jgi:hypothetical protein
MTRLAGHGPPDELPVAIEATGTCAPTATGYAVCNPAMRFALGNALLDTSIATWNAKCLQDTVRPIAAALRRPSTRAHAIRPAQATGRASGTVAVAGRVPIVPVAARQAARGCFSLPCCEG